MVICLVLRSTESWRTDNLRFNSHSLYRRPSHQNVLVVRLHIQLGLSVIHQLQVIYYNQRTYKHTVLRFNSLLSDTIRWILFLANCCRNQPLGPSIFLNWRNSCSSFLKGEYLKMSSVSVAYFSVSWVRGCWVFASQLGNGTITYENRPITLRDLHVCMVPCQKSVSYLIQTLFFVKCSRQKQTR